jgi:hypothetical protein
LPASKNQHNNGSRGFTSPNRKPPEGGFLFQPDDSNQAAINANFDFRTCAMPDRRLPSKAALLLAWRFREAVRQNEVERTFAFMAATVDASSRIPTEEQTVAFTAKAPVALGERRFGDVVWKVEIESLCLMLSARYARSLGGSEMHDAASNAPLEPVAVGV